MLVLVIVIWKQKVEVQGYHMKDCKNWNWIEQLKKKKQYHIEFLQKVETALWIITLRVHLIIDKQWKYKQMIK